MKKLLIALAALALAACCATASLATSYMIFPTGPILPDASPSPTPAASLYVEFKADTAVYKKAGSGKTDVVILKGSTALATKRSKDKKWVRILYGKNNQEPGWVPFKRLKRASLDYPLINYASASGRVAQVDLNDAARLAGTRFKVRVDTDVYKTGSSSSKVLGRLRAGLTVTATGKLRVDSSGVFFLKITYKGKSGWVPETSLKGASSAINSAILK